MLSFGAEHALQILEGCVVGRAQEGAQNELPICIRHIWMTSSEVFFYLFIFAYAYLLIHDDRHPFLDSSINVKLTDSNNIHILRP